MFRLRLTTTYLAITCWGLFFVASLHADTADSERPSRDGLNKYQLRAVDEMEELRYTFENGEQDVTKARSTKMSDAALHEIRDITTLTSIYAACRSDISDYGMQCFEKLTEVESLSVRGERITNEGVESLAKLTKLKTLWLIGADIDNECLATIVKLRNLESLYFSDTRVTKDAALILREELPECKVNIRTRK
ncbi:MAG: hypothetical protein ACI9HK_000373 [Pirellulaceae bacterium]|jgi:hypothetical protein